MESEIYINLPKTPKIENILRNSIHDNGWITILPCDRSHAYDPYIIILSLISWAHLDKFKNLLNCSTTSPLASFHSDHFPFLTTKAINIILNIFFWSVCLTEFLLVISVVSNSYKRYIEVEEIFYLFICFIKILNFLPLFWMTKFQEF